MEIGDLGRYRGRQNPGVKAANFVKGLGTGKSHAALEAKALVPIAISFRGFFNSVWFDIAPETSRSFVVLLLTWKVKSMIASNPLSLLTRLVCLAAAHIFLTRECKHLLCGMSATR